MWNFITVAPNEASINKTFKVEIYNILGQLVISKTTRTASAIELIDGTSLITGNYNLRTIKDTELVAQKKIIINNNNNFKKFQKLPGLKMRRLTSIIILLLEA